MMVKITCVSESTQVITGENGNVIKHNQRTHFIYWKSNLATHSASLFYLYLREYTRRRQDCHGFFFASCDH